MNGELLPAGAGGTAILLAAGGLIGRAQAGGCGRPWWLFAGPALAVWWFLVAALGRYLDADRAVGARGEITPATWVTLLRGLLVAGIGGLTGFTGCGFGILWAAAFSYVLVALLDSVDGTLARRTGRTSRSGARLDVLTDAIGLVVAPVCAVVARQLPPWYLLLGAAYPAMHLSLLLRERLGLPVHRERLRPDPRARTMAGVQMVLVAVALCPVAPRQIIWPAATVVMLPTLFLFAREWWVATRP